MTNERRPYSGAIRRAAAAGCVMGILWATNAAAQIVVAPIEQMSFDRPEAWALKYFTSATMLSGLELPEAGRPGSVTIGLEGHWLPTLSPEQRRVGFNGTAPQDLNKAPLFVRPRVSVGLPGRFLVTVAGVPPIRSFGLKPRLAAASVEWTAYDSNDWRIAGRAHGQVGTVTGAFTCPSSVLVFPPGSSSNRTGCLAESADVATLRYGGLEIDAMRRIAQLRGLTPHVAAGVNAIDAALQVSARTFDFIDRTRLETKGTTFSLSGGVGIPVSDGVALAIDLFYAPLTVRRTAGAPRTNDGLFNVRGLISYRLR